MKTIEIDDQVFAYLQSNAIPYIETIPNLTLRRLFKLNGDTIQSGSKPKGEKRKQAKADLRILVKANLLQNGQKLFLHNYQGRRINGYEAVISGKSLLWNGEMFSMSALARDLLKKENFTSDSVQGPARWYNSDGISVKELWDQLLRN